MVLSSVMYNKECHEYCYLLKNGRKCEQGDPVNKSGNADTTPLCIYYPCEDAREQAEFAWLDTLWSESCIEIGNKTPETCEVLIKNKLSLMELTPFETPKQKEAGIFPGYQMYLNYSGDIFARSRLDQIIRPVGINIWDEKLLNELY